MILTKKQILAEAKKQNIVLDGVKDYQVNHDSVDVGLFEKVWLSTESFLNTLLNLKTKRDILNKEVYSKNNMPIEQSEIINRQLHNLEEIKSKIISTVKGWYLVNISEPATFVNGLFVLGSIDEWVGTKSNTDLCCEFRLKSTPARLGLDHAFASWIETGYFSRLCLELTFNQSVELQKGSMIGQFIFHKTTDDTVDYIKGGSYQSTTNLDKLKTNWEIQDILPKSKIKIKL